METYTLEATKATPYVLIDPGASRMEITGSSYPENGSSFYQPVFDKLEELIRALDAPLTVDLQMIYLNSSSSKIFMLLLERLDELAASGPPVLVNWRYHIENESALEIGEEFMDELRHANFALVPTTD